MERSPSLTVGTLGSVVLKSQLYGIAVILGGFLVYGVQLE